MVAGGEGEVEVGGGIDGEMLSFASDVTIERDGRLFPTHGIRDLTAMHDTNC